VEVVASLSQGRTAAAQCGLFTHKSVPVIFEPPCIYGTGVAVKVAFCGFLRWRRELAVEQNQNENKHSPVYYLGNAQTNESST